MDEAAVADMFGTTEGFTATAVTPEPRVIDAEEDEDEDF